MSDAAATESDDVLDFLAEEAPGELERLRSIDALVTSWTDWGQGVHDSRHPDYSTWLRQTYGLFRPGPQPDQAA